MMRVMRAVVVAVASVLVWLSLVWVQERLAMRGPCVIGYVYDGDTVAMDCGGGEVTARVMGFDAPETVRARCELERVAGDRATDRLRALVGAGPVVIRRHGKDKYGRDLIRLEVAGHDVARVMVEEGLAVAYDGGARRDWCAFLARGED